MENTKRIGLIGGMSPESTTVYYERIVHEYVRRYGNHNYPEILIYSVTFQPYIDMQKSGEWDDIASGLIDVAHRLISAGAEVLGIATNTMHIVYEQIQRAVKIPIISILDAVAVEIQQLGLKHVAILGTRSTMTLNPYAAALERHNINTLVPEKEDIDLIDEIIFSELIAGQILDHSREKYLKAINRLKQRGAEGVVLGCTEIPLLIRKEDTEMPLLDSAHIHADALLNAALH